MTEDSKAPPLRIALVGPCTAGKSTLAQVLRAYGFEVRMPAQEHSYVPAMWQKLSKPDILIYLDVDFANTLARRPGNPGTPERLAEQQRRLAHARAHCDLYLDTSGQTASTIQAQVLAFLQKEGVIGG